MDTVILEGLTSEFPSINQEKPNSHDWSYLLLCASVLARSEKPDEQRAALRIADTCLALGYTSAEEKAAAAIVLDTMANRRSVEMAAKRGLVPTDLEAQLPLPLKADFLRRTAEDRILTADGTAWPANRFQTLFWEALAENQWVSASAPTSAGKSFLLRLWVAEFFQRKANAFIAFVVPTRALIQEFWDSFAGDLAKGVLKNVNLHTLPLEENFAPDAGHLFIFTQERLQILLGRERNLAYDVLIVDEAQKVGEGYRGVLLEQVIAECVRRSTETQVIYSSPFVDNPAYLMRGAPVDAVTSAVQREVTTVTQNLLFVSQQRGDPSTWIVTFVDGDRQLLGGTVALPFRATSDSKRLTAVAFAMRSPTGGNLIYANGPARAESYAQQISDAFATQEIASLETNPRISDLITLIRRVIHPQYLLAETLKNGVGFHYGNMPLLIRTEIESLFRENILRFLVCTATLIEGVNLPCKVIFLRGPTKGVGHPMVAQDFWNLAGRAGRWGTEFHGSIVCIDPLRRDVWKEPPPTRRVRQHIKAVTEQALEDAGAILGYVANGYPFAIAQEHPEYDYTVTFLLHALMQGDQLADLPSALAIPSSDRDALEVLLTQEIATSPLPADMVFNHPGILPHAMMDLLQVFRGMSSEQLQTLSPVLPESQDAVDRYTSIFRFINEHLRANWSTRGTAGDKRLVQLAILSIDWMRGRPLAVLISARERVNRRRAAAGRTPKKLPAIIIEVMKDVEESARFKIPKYLRAFLDVLYLHARDSGLTSVIRHLPDLELWLELGVSVRTQLSLMELGLSRTAAIEIFERIMNDNMDKEAALKWLRAANLPALNLPELVKRDVERVLERYSKAAPSVSNQ